MDVRNCPRCGKVFVSTGQKLCPSCLRQQEELFRKVREYLRLHPGANVEEVAAGTEVDKELILEFIRSGRLITLKAEGLLRCDICGRPIDRGRICDQCADELKKGLGKVKEAQPQAVREAASTREHRVHIADMLKEKDGGRLRGR